MPTGVEQAARQAKQMALLFSRTSVSWQEDKPGSIIEFDGSVLERTASSAGRNPYLVVSVDGKLIPDHNDITDPRIIEFVNQLILISSQSPEQQAQPGCSEAESRN